MRLNLSFELPPALEVEMAYTGWGYDPEMEALWRELVEAYAPLAHGIPIRWRVGAKVHQAAAWRKEKGVWTVELSPLLFSRYPIFLARRYGLPMGLPPLHALVRVLEEEGRAAPLPLEGAFWKLARSREPVMALVAYAASRPKAPLPFLVEMAVGNPQALTSYLGALEAVEGRDLARSLAGHPLLGPVFAFALEEAGGVSPPAPAEEGLPDLPPPSPKFPEAPPPPLRPAPRRGLRGGPRLEDPLRRPPPGRGDRRPLGGPPGVAGLLVLAGQGRGPSVGRQGNPRGRWERRCA
ncbi:hypothetical protein [Thermus thermophilus]|uniref:Uncharacterized protein n=1 Tax=Thermus thermophilus JL-18 TaxID=798128 RepID=H9ZUC8_THETH|nr:hypothetical protein [Thermus thermophilus]AFH39938.1 hypothetical protein TtJL18_2088 [Thermus thermophilus JL-18]